MTDKPSRTPTDVQADIDAWTAKREAAHRDLDTIRNERKVALLTASLDEIVTFDARLARADAAADQAGARIEVLEAELAVAEEAADHRARADNLVRARAIADEIEQLENEYEAKANAVAKILGKLLDLNCELTGCNANLPAYEPDAAAPSRLVRFVVLPSPRRDAAAIWDRQPRQVFSPYAAHGAPVSF